ncbi:hypothetical protein CJA_3606 [Cellvibrio japonicus Ueda107]|uniref:MchC protein n=2 Tax=Cellvibrio japonicus TaxID=155077 RepID=B3PH11_CELJU|nr:hypothetical protein CJA_3606 [Cellvibrio japonicus Ueda107]
MFNESLINFEVTKMEEAEFVWAQFPEDSTSGAPHFSSAKDITSTFAYGIKGNRYFDEIAFSANDTKNAQAEIYPGGSNAGGSRSGNIAGYHVKGMGANPLLGEVDYDWYSYGGLSFYEAALEAINTIILNAILPYGCVNCYAIIKTGDRTALHPTGKLLDDNRGKGALLVREQCLRPAHFFPLENFVPVDRNQYLVEFDQERVSSLSQKLLNLLGGIDRLNDYIVNFYIKSAAQFSTAKIFRIFHGAMNYSNISFDGRWLDVATTAFVQGGSDYGVNRPLPSFYKEHISPLNYINVFYQEIDGIIPKEMIVKIYSAELKKHTIRSFIKIMGINKEPSESIVDLPVISELAMKFWDCVLDASGSSGEINLPMVVDENDPSLIHLKRLHHDLLLFTKDKNRTSLISEFYTAFCSQIGLCTHDEVCEFIRHSLLRSSRLIYGGEFFVGGRLRTYLDSLVRNEPEHHVGQFISAVDDISKWVFNFSEEQVTLFSSTACRVIYSDSRFYFEIRGYVKHVNNPENAYKIALHIHNQDLSVAHFCFKKALLNSISAIV